jgi:hypothetical protein
MERVCLQLATAEHLGDSFHNAMTACTKEYTSLLKILDGLFTKSFRDSPIVGTFNIKIYRSRSCRLLGFPSGWDLVLEYIYIGRGDEVFAVKDTFVCVSGTINTTWRAITIVCM